MVSRVFAIAVAVVFCASCSDPELTGAAIQGKLGGLKGAGTKVDADTIDGLEAAEFAPALHGHIGTDISGEVALAEHARTAATIPWTGVEGKPAQFPPSAHTHEGPEITGKVAAASSADTVPWSGVTGTPSTFPASAHTHPSTEIVGPVSKAAVADAVAWTGVTDKPATFPPASHTHGAAEITTGTLATDRLPFRQLIATGVCAGLRSFGRAKAVPFTTAAQSGTTLCQGQPTTIGQKCRDVVRIVTESEFESQISCNTTVTAAGATPDQMFACCDESWAFCALDEVWSGKGCVEIVTGTGRAATSWLNAVTTCDNAGGELCRATELVTSGAGFSAGEWTGDIYDVNDSITAISTNGVYSFGHQPRASAQLPFRCCFPIRNVR